MMAGLAIITIPLAFLTWRYVERPFRNRHFLSRKIVLFFSLSFSAIFITFGWFGNIQRGYFDRPEYSVTLSSMEDAVRVNQGLNEICDGEYTDSPKCRTSETPKIIVWGDSFAMHLVDGIIASNPKVQLVQATLSVCGPFFDVAPFFLPNNGIEWGKKCIEANDKVRALLKSSKSIKYAVLSSPFRKFVGDGAKLLTRDGQIISGEESANAFFERTLKEIENLGIVPIVVSPTPRNGNNIGNCLIKASIFDVEKQRCSFQLDVSEKRDQKVNDFLRRVELKNKVIWLSNGICPLGTCNASVGDVFIYRDSLHLSHGGSAYIGNQMEFYRLITNHRN